MSIILVVAATARNSGDIGQTILMISDECGVSTADGLRPSIAGGSVLRQATPMLAPGVNRLTQRKRRRDSNSESDHAQHMRRESPKRRKGDDDDIAPGQSVSHAGSVVELNDWTTFSSLSASSKRSTSLITAEDAAEDRPAPNPTRSSLESFNKQRLR
ncbi:hypothetical protein EJ07DRAFT_157506 [Lizonia empirigonia]|nr:hypothetical protein EJ07DRAFT_157506 [Lizonia empirigonia]